MSFPLFPRFWQARRFAVTLLALLGTALFGQSNTPSASDGFDPNVNGIVNIALVQKADGKVLLGGTFTTVRPNGAADNIDRNYLARVNADGTLDVDFNPNANGAIYAMAVQADGKILVGGAFTTIGGVTRNRLARLNADGTLDTGFDPNMGGGLAPEVYALLVLPDNRIVVGGAFTTVGGTVRNRLARLSSTGALDPTFNPNANGAVLSLGRQVDGALLVGGSFTSFQPAGDSDPTVRNHLARFNLLDRPDSQFDPKPDNAVTAIVVQTDGLIVIGGNFNTLQPLGSDSAVSRSRIARLQVDGTLDSFYSPNANGQVNSLVLQPDGRLLLAGNFTSLTPNGTTAAVSRTFVARLNVDGTADTGFQVNSNGPIQTIALQSDGRIVAGGYFTQLRVSSITVGVNRNHVARLNADGTPDTTLDPATSGLIIAQAVQSDGRIVVVGTFTIMGGLTRNYIARLNADGSVDTSFNPQINNAVFTVAIQSADQKILIGGPFTNIGGKTRYYLARLQPDGTLDAAFNPTPNGQLSALGVQADKKILISGSFSSLTPEGSGATARAFLARLNEDGSVDTGFNPTPDAAANVITIQSDNKILLGGSFSSFTPNAGTLVQRSYAARLNTDGTVDTTYYPLPNGPVLTQVIQSDGKIILGGNFTAFRPNATGDVVVRYFIARVNTDSSIDTAFNPRAGGSVAALVVQSDGKIVAGGQFGFFRPGDDVTKNVDRGRISRINADGTVDASYDPNSGGQITSLILLSTGKILVAGGFSSMKPASQGLILLRNRIARLNTDGTVDTAFDPSVTTKNGGLINSLALQPDGQLIVGGEFNNFGGSRSSYLSRFKASGDADTNYTPNADGPVATVLVQPTRTTSVQASLFGWFNRDSSLRASFSTSVVSQLTGEIRAVFVQPDGKIIIGGLFSHKTDASIGNLIRLNKDGTLDTTWRPTPAGVVYALARQSDGSIIIGGGFDSVSGTTRYRIARINTDGKVDSSYDPYASDVVYALAVQSDDKVVVGGAFTTFQPNGATTTTARTYLARLEKTGVPDTAYNPTPNALVRALVVQPDGLVIAGGDFTTLTPASTSTAVARNYIARLKVDGTVDDGFNPSANAGVYAIALQPSDSKPVIGGLFTVVQPNANTNNSFFRNHIARLNTDGTMDTNFDPSANNAVYSISVAFDGQIVIGGTFTTLQPGSTFNAVVRNHLALVGSDGSINAAFNPSPTGDVLAVAALADGSILAGGSYTSLASDANLLVGGAFTNIGGITISNLALLDVDGNASPLFAPNPNGAVAALVQQADTKIIVGGSFTNLGGPRNRLARIATDGTVDTAYNPNVDGAVSALALQLDGKLVIGGTFTTVGGVPRAALARINGDATGTLDTSFAPSANGQVSALLLRPDGKIVVAGSFTAISGTARNRLARLNADGSLDLTFNPNVNGPVVTLVASADGKIIIGGTFTSVGTAGRNNVARLNADGTLDANFDPGADGSVLALALQADGAPVLAGAFNTVTGQPRYRLARLGVGTTIATQSVSSSSNRSTLTWTRGGSSPELSAVRFEISTDNLTWTTLGTATRVSATPSNWELKGLTTLSSTDTFYVRANGIAPTSKNASAGLLQSAQVFNFAVTPVFSTGGVVAATSGKSFRYSTADGTTAVYSAIGLPAGLSIDAATGIITGTPTETGDFAVTVTASNSGGNVSAALTLSVGGTGSPVAGGSIRLINLSARAQVAGNGTAITGFNSSGGSVLIRAIGPGLTSFGVSGALADPVLNVYNSAGVQVSTNNDWSGANVSTTAAATGAFPLTVGSKDAALVLNLDAGGYTAQVTDATGRGGVVLTEVYDANGATVTPRFNNLSTRAPVAPGAPLVGGFVITSASGTATQRVLIRGVGPGITKFGVTNALSDPVLKVYDSTGALIATNDNWSGSDVSTAASATGAFALDAGSKDAALLLTLAPGGYTFEITGANATSGEALADIYAAP